MRFRRMAFSRAEGARFGSRALDGALVAGLVMVGLGNLAVPASLQTLLGPDYLLIAFGLLGLAVILRLRTSILRRPPWAVAAILGLSAVPGFIVGPQSDYGMQKVQTFVIIVVLLIAAASLSDVERGARHVMTATIVIALLFALLMILASERLPNDRVTLVGLNPVGVARLIALGGALLVATLVTWARGRNALATLGVAGLVLCTVATALTGSRAPLLSAAVAGGAVWLARQRTSHRRPFWRSPVSWVVLALVGFVLGVAAALGTLTSLASRGASGRSELYSAAVSSIVADPLGLGWGNFGSLVGRDDAVVYPHNLYLEAAVEGGMLAFAAMAAVTAWCLVLAVTNFRATLHASSLMVLAFYVFALANAQFSSDIVGNRMLWVAMALVVAEHSVSKGRGRAAGNGLVSPRVGGSEEGQTLVGGSTTAHILVVEPRHSGHLLLYVKLIAESALARGEQVSLALGPGVATSVEYAHHLATLDLPTYEIESPAEISACAAIANEIGATTVVVPHADEVLASAAIGKWKLKAQLVLLVTRDPRWEFPAPLRRVAKNVVKLFAADFASLRPYVTVVWLRQIGYRGVDPHVEDPYVADGSLPEIQAAAATMRGSLGMSADRFWFVITGAITDRKHVPMVMDALSAIATDSEHKRSLGLALIGPLRFSDPVLRDRLEEQAKGSGLRLIIDDRELSNFEMNAAVSAADAVVMAYSTHSPNSTMVKAYAAGVRLVVAGPRSVRKFARDLGFEHVSPLRPGDLRASLEKVLEAPQPSPRTVSATGMDLIQHARAR